MARIGEPPDGDIPVGLIFLLALVVRVAVALSQLPPSAGGGWTFEQYGLRIAAGHGFGPSSGLPPLYPYFLAMLYRVYGYSHHAVVLAQALIGSLTAVLVVLMAQRSGMRRTGIAASGILAALFPAAVAEVRHLTPQILVGALFATAAWAWMRSLPLPKRTEALATGFLVGIAILGRTGVILPAAVLFLARGRWEATWRTGASLRHLFPGGSEAWFLRALAVLAVGIAIAPWVVRNTQLHGRPAFVETTWALRLRSVTVPDSIQFRFQSPSVAIQSPDNLVLTDNDLALRETLGYAMARPGDLLRTYAARVSRYFSFRGRSDISPADPFPYGRTWYRWLHAITFACVLTLVASWAILLRGRGAVEQACASVALGYLLLGVLAGSTGDARLFGIPFLAVIAGRGLEGLTRFGPAVSGSEAAGLARRGLFVLLVVLIWVHGTWAIVAR